MTGVQWCLSMVVIVVFLLHEVSWHKGLWNLVARQVR